MHIFNLYPCSTQTVSAQVPEQFPSCFKTKQNPTNSPKKQLTRPERLFGLTITSSPFTNIHKRISNCVQYLLKAHKL